MRNWVKWPMNFPCAVIYLFMVTLILPNKANSQFCTGSLGDPVVNIDFGNGTGSSTFTPPPGYIYTSSSCPNDGYYTITTNTSGCFGNSWHTVNTDHTGNGAFMLVNASNLPSDFFLTTLNGLCPNTTYEFSAWIMNVLVPGGIDPNLTFTIETSTGTILNSFNTGNIQRSATPTWLPFRFYFSTSSSISSVVLRIRNNAPGGAGNDLALDDISFRPCGPQLLSSIQGYANTVDVCVDNQSVYVFNGVVSPGYITPVYQWQVSVDSASTWSDIPGATGLSYTRSASAAGGNYWYRLTVAESVNAANSSCRVSSNRLEINIERKPQISAGPDRIILIGGNTILDGVVSVPNLVLSWSPPDHLSDVTSLRPTADPTQDIYYTLSAISKTGCTNSDQVLVKVVKDIFVPTAFTPNNDGKNDRWRIPFLDPAWNAQVNVYNRYGNLVYTSSGYVDWDGKLKGVLQSSGTYVYFIEFPGIAGIRKGVLQLIR